MNFFNRISQRPPQVKLSADCASQALLNEHFELDITVENQEQDAIDASLSIEIKDATGHGKLERGWMLWIMITDIYAKYRSTNN